MNIFKKDLKDHLKTFLVWTITLSLFNYWMMTLFASFQDTSGMLEFVQQLPEAFLKAFGVDRLSLATLEGYFGTEVHLLILLFGSIFAVLLGSGILSKEQNDRTAEFLLSKPVSRVKILVGKALVYITLLALFNAVIWAGAYWEIKRYDTPFDERSFWLLAGMTLGAHLTFATLGFLGSVFVNRQGTVYAGSLGLVLGMYAVQLMSDLSENLRFLGHISPMKWANAADILSTGTVSPGHIWAMILVNGVAWALALEFYKRKDILM